MGKGLAIGNEAFSVHLDRGPCGPTAIDVIADCAWALPFAFAEFGGVGKHTQISFELGREGPDSGFLTAISAAGVVAT